MNALEITRYLRGEDFYIVVGGQRWKIRVTKLDVAESFGDSFLGAYNEGRIPYARDSVMRVTIEGYVMERDQYALSAPPLVVEERIPQEIPPELPKPKRRRKPTALVPIAGLPPPTPAPPAPKPAKRSEVAARISALDLSEDVPPEDE